MAKSKAQLAAEKKATASAPAPAAAAPATEAPAETPFVPPTSVPAATSFAAASGLNLELLQHIVTATSQAPYYTYAAPSDIAPLAQNGYVEENPDRSTDQPNGHRVVRATPQGIHFMQQQQPAASPAPFGSQPAFGGGFPQSASASTPVNLVAPATAPVGTYEYAIVTPTMPKPAKKESRVGKPSSYPFDALPVGQAFFIPATAERPDPWKSLASTVASAGNRYAVPKKDAAGNVLMRDAKRGDTVKQVPILEKSRTFELHKIDDGGAAGFGAQFAGKAGAGVWRTA